MEYPKYDIAELIQYIRPIWYFSLKPNTKNNTVWTEYDNLTSDEKQLINYDLDYSNKDLIKWDASYQALMKGVVNNSRVELKVDKINFKPRDIYHFIRKYNKKKWLYITFLHRILCLNNPVKEFLECYSTRHVKKINLFTKHYIFKDYVSFVSPLIKQNPLVSIILPTLNRYEVLGDVLQDLEKQTYSNFELLIIDQSTQFNKFFYNKFNFKYQIIRQKRKALWAARNNGIKSSNSDFLLFLDDDSRIDSNWIMEHLKCIDYFKADISSGVSISTFGSKVPENYSFFRYSDQLDTGNVLIKRVVFEKCGMFDEKFEKMRMGDKEFGVRSYLNGFKNISNPRSFRSHLKYSKGGLREIGHWDGFRPISIFSPRPVPSVVYLYKKYWGSKFTFLSIIHTIPFTFCPYSLKGKMMGSILSFLIFILFFPYILILISISYKRAGNMRGSKKEF
tara:strand:+ start:25656 stop:27002 length:1347 start_codon:yes stop_codon:yes gene_type:complete